MTTTSTARIGRRRDTAHAAAEGAQTLRDDVGDATRDIADRAQRQASRVRAAVDEWFDDHAGRARHTIDRLRDRAIYAGECGQRYMRDEPLKSMLMAAGVGALLAALAMNTPRRR